MSSPAQGVRAWRAQALKLKTWSLGLTRGPYGGLGCREFREFREFRELRV